MKRSEQRITPSERIEQISKRLHSKPKAVKEPAYKLQCVTCTRMHNTPFSECTRCAQNRIMRLVRDGYRMHGTPTKIPKHRVHGSGRPFPYSVVLKTEQTSEGALLSVNDIPIGTVLESKKA